MSTDFSKLAIWLQANLLLPSLPILDFKGIQITKRIRLGNIINYSPTGLKRVKLQNFPGANLDSNVNAAVNDTMTHESVNWISPDENNDIVYFVRQ